MLTIKNGRIQAEEFTFVLPEGMTDLDEMSLEGMVALTTLTIPSSMEDIYESALGGCMALTDIHYGGTKAQWNAIDKREGWDQGTGAYTVHCTDGDIAKG